MKLLFSLIVGVFLNMIFGVGISVYFSICEHFIRKVVKFSENVPPLMQCIDYGFNILCL